MCHPCIFKTGFIYCCCFLSLSCLEFPSLFHLKYRVNWASECLNIPAPLSESKGRTRSWAELSKDQENGLKPPQIPNSLKTPQFFKYYLWSIYKKKKKKLGPWSISGARAHLVGETLQGYASSGLSLFGKTPWSSKERRRKCVRYLNFLKIIYFLLL